MSEFLNALERAKQKAKELSQQTDTSNLQLKKYKPETVTLEFDIPSHMAPLVQGRQGEGLRNIELSTNCNITLVDNNGVKKVTITGEGLAAKEAKKKIDSICFGDGSLAVITGEQSQLGYKTIFVQVPTQRVGLVIGKGGETIRALQEKTGARINLCKDGEMDNPLNTKSLVVFGPPQCIKLAQQYIDDIVSGNSYAGTFSITGDSEILMVPKEKIGQVIGKGGETIKEIQNRAQVKLTIDSRNEKDGERAVILFNKVCITGSKENIKTAREMINLHVWGNKRGMLGDADDYGVKLDKELAAKDPAYSAAYGMGVPQTYGYDYAKMMGYDEDTWKAYVEYYAQYYASLEFPVEKE